MRRLSTLVRLFVLASLATASADQASATAGVSFSLYAVTAHPGDTVTLKSLAYSGGAPVSGLTVQFSVAGIPVGSGVSNSTSVTCNYTVPASMPHGVYDVKVSFAGDGRYGAASRTSAVLTVTGVNVLFSIYAVSGSPGQSVTLRSLVYSGGAPASGLTVQFSVDGSPVGAAVSDTAGAACSYTISSTMMPGPHNVTVSFADDGVHNSAARTTAALTVPRFNIALSIYPVSGGPGQTVTLRSLVYGRGAPVSGLTMQFSVDGSPVGSGISDASGVACAAPAPTTGGPHSVTVTFAGDATYNPASRTTPALTVRNGGLEMGSPWPKFHGNAANTGRGIASGATGRLKWRYKAGNRVQSSPAIGADGTVYIGSNDSYVYALNPADGSLKWRYQTGAEVVSSPAIGADGTVYVGSNDSYVYALNPADGSLKWRYQTGAEVTSSPAIGSDGTVYVGSNNYYFYALDPVNGSLKWRFLTGWYLGVQSSAAIGADGTVYFGATDQYVYALNPADGSLKWQYQTGSKVQSPPSIGADGTVYVGSDDGYVYALDPSDGKLKWRYRVGNMVRTSPAIAADGTVYVGSIFNFYFYALNPADGTLRWQSQVLFGEVQSSAAIGTDGTVFVGSLGGYMYAIDPVDGSQNWHYLTGVSVYSSPAIGSDGTVYVGNEDGYVYAFE